MTVYPYDTGDRAAADLDAQTAAAEAVDWQGEASGFGVCPECGSADGMQHYDRDCVRRMLQSETWHCGSDMPHLRVRKFSRYYKPEAWYRLAEPSEMYRQHHVHVPCWTCNQSERIPDGFVRLDGFALDAWLAQECECEDCRRQ